MPVSYMAFRISFLNRLNLSERAPLFLGDHPKRLESCQSLTGSGAHNIYACQDFTLLTQSKVQYHEQSCWSARPMQNCRGESGGQVT